jgi:amidohydrolase
MQSELHQRIRTAATESAGASAEVKIVIGYLVTYNDPDLTARMAPTLERVAGSGRLRKGIPRTGVEDFAILSRETPDLYFWLGGRSPDVAEQDAAPNHSPLFQVDEGARIPGVRAMANLAVDFLQMQSAKEIR